MQTQTTIKNSEKLDTNTLKNDKTEDSVSTVTMQAKSANLSATQESNKNRNHLDIETPRSRALSPSASKQYVEIKTPPTTKDKIKNCLFTAFCAWDCWRPFVIIQVISITTMLV